MFRILTFFLLLFLLHGCKTTRQQKTELVENILLDSIEITAPRENPYRSTATKQFDLVHTRLEVKFDYGKQYLFGKATITLKPHFYPQYNLVLDARQFDIHKVALVKSDNSKEELQYTYDSVQLKIQLNRRYDAGEKLTVFIDYTAKPEERIAGGSEAISSDKGLYFINPHGEDSTKPIQIWTQGETESSSGWFPTIDKPNQKTTQEIFITRDKKYLSLSNGSLISSTDNKDGTYTDYWKQDLPHAPYLFMMTIGDFFVLNEMWRDVPVSYYVERKYAPFAKKIFGNTPEMMEFFSQKLGFDYPWAKYAQIVVRDYVSGAMENTSATLHSDILQRDNRELLDETHEDYISHELFHQWFGDLVTCESWSNIPLNESFATYGEYLWAEYKYGKDEADYRWRENYDQYLAEAETKNVDLVRFYYDDKEDMFDRHSYQKGGLILHYLRQIVGDDAFFKSIALYLKNNQFKTVEVHQLRLAFEEVTGRDLNPFFNQWFLNKGHPVLDIRHNYFGDSLILNIAQKHNVEESSLVYNLPIRIDLWFGDVVQSEYVELSKKEHRFAWQASQAPDLVDVDAQRVVICEKKENKTAANYAFQYKMSKSLLPRYEAILQATQMQKENDEAKALIRLALVDPFFAIRKMAIDKLQAEADEPESTFSLLDSLARLDVNSRVRNAAISKLAASRVAKNYASTFEQMVGDSSYLVSGGALSALGTANAPKALEFAALFENDPNQNMLNAVAAVYAKSGNETHQAFFERVLGPKSAASKYSLIYYYANYLTRMDKSVVVNGIATIEQNGHNKENYYLASAARGSLKRIVRSFEEKKTLTEKELTEKSSEPEKQKAEQKLSDYNDILSAAGEALKRLQAK